MAKKRRVTFKLDEEEALVIAPVSFWQEICDLFSSYASHPEAEDPEGWAEAARVIDTWVSKTASQEYFTQYIDDPGVT